MRSLRLLLLLIVIGACADDHVTGSGQEPDGARLDPSVVILSNAVFAEASAPPDAAARVGLVYVSLAPGTLDRGTAVLITSVAAGATVTAPLIDGGFDPVGIAAAAGQKLTIRVLQGDVLGSAIELVVPPKRPPRIVRTNPASKKHDVPLNTIILIVFSEPVDTLTIDTLSVRLTAGTDRVRGHFEFGGAPGTTATFVPERPLASGTDYRLTVGSAVADLEGERLEGDVTVDFSTIVAPALSRIVFRVLDRGIFVMNADGSDRRQLTDGDDRSPTWSPDGSRIAFENMNDIYIMNSDGTGRTRLTWDRRSSAPAWSPDGSRIAFVSGRASTTQEGIYQVLHVMNADGSGVRRVTQGDFLEDTPSWSPDGSMIVFVRADYIPIDNVVESTGLLHLVAPDGSDLRRVSPATHTDEYQPTWSPDGTRIAFTSEDGIYVMNAAGSARRKVVDAGGRADWSPDGTRLVVEGMALVNLDGSQQTFLGEGTDPAWTRTGRAPPLPQLQLAKSAGDQQVDTVLAELAPLRLRVTRAGVPAAGLRVLWNVVTYEHQVGVSTVTPDTSYTDENGVATATLTLGTSAWYHDVKAWLDSRGQAGSQFVWFRARANPGTPVRLTGDWRGADVVHVAAIGGLLRFGVGALDAYDNAVSGLPVSWLVTAGDGTATPSSGTIDPESFQSDVAWTLGPAEGRHTLEATSPVLPESRVTFSADAVTAMVRFISTTCGMSSRTPHFSPGNVTVQAGQSVGWSADYDCTPHNVTFEDEPTQPASSGTLPEDDFYNYHRRTFTTPGIYRYRCTLHSTDFENGEVGVVTVG